MPDQGFTDTEILNWLEARLKESKYTGRCVMRWSSTGRGWRLHETSRPNAHTSVRQALVCAMIDEKEEEWS